MKFHFFLTPFMHLGIEPLGNNTPPPKENTDWLPSPLPLTCYKGFHLLNLLAIVGSSWQQSQRETNMHADKMVCSRRQWLLSADGGLNHYGGVEGRGARGGPAWSSLKAWKIPCSRLQKQAHGQEGCKRHRKQKQSNWRHDDNTASVLASLTCHNHDGAV